MITSTTNTAVKAARQLAARRGRARADAFLVEGPQAVREAVGCLRRLFVTPRAARRDARLVACVEGRGVEVLHVSEDVLAQIADTVTPQGVVGVATLPPIGLAAALEPATLVVVGVQVADPGNVGVIVRTADAAGVDAVVLTAGSVDACNPKAVRASAGSLFHLPVVGDADLDSVLAECRARGVQLVATDARAHKTYTEVDLRAPTALLFGNEAGGLSREVLAACDLVVRIPIHQRAGASAESLNLATAVAVVAYEAARQRQRPSTVGMHEATARGGP